MHSSGLSRSIARHIVNCKQNLFPKFYKKFLENSTGWSKNRQLAVYTAVVVNSVSSNWIASSSSRCYLRGDNNLDVIGLPGSSRGT